MGLFIFLLVATSIYGSLHFYAFVKARHALNFGLLANILVGFFMVVMVFAPILTRVFERLDFEFISRVFAYVGYVWMGLLFIFCSAAFVLDIYRLVVYLAGLVASSELAKLALSPRTAFITAFIISSLATAYGYFEAVAIRTEHLEIESAKIPESLSKVRIVQISDVHIGVMVRGNRLRGILQKVKDAKPDILVSTGDLLDGQVSDVSSISSLFQDIEAKYGKFAITGNHEFYVGLRHAMEFMGQAGFTILRGESRDVEGFLNIVGVDDPQGIPYKLSKEASEKVLLSGLSKDKFTVLLKHRPTIEKGSEGLFDLQLSGHTHGGQIFPFRFPVMLMYPRTSGHFRLQNNTHFYINRGSGTWGPPIRFLAPPEVTVIDLVRPK